MKDEKVPALSSEHKEALVRLSTNPDFKALLGLFKIEENNIIVEAFKYVSPDTVAEARKKDWYKGRVYELRKIIKTFELAKGKEE